MASARSTYLLDGSNFSIVIDLTLPGADEFACTGNMILEACCQSPSVVANDDDDDDNNTDEEEEDDDELDEDDDLTLDRSVNGSMKSISLNNVGLAS